MARQDKADQPFNILIIGQSGRLQYEALLLVLSLRASSPDFAGQVIVAEQLVENGARIVPFENKHFGQAYPYGNKIEGLSALPEGEPFIFFDTDTLILGDLGKAKIDFNRPAASMRREGTWPVEELYWPGYTAIWKSLYDKFGLEFASSLNLTQPDEYWERYLYFNAGWFLGADPAAFGKRFTEYACAIRAEPTQEMLLQPLDPWLDQVALPLVIHGLGGGRPGPELAGFDGDLTCHYRMFPLLYARESQAAVDLLEQIAAPNKVKKLLKDHDPIKRMVYNGQGAKVRAMFDQSDLPRLEKQLRNKIRAAGFWMR